LNVQPLVRPSHRISGRLLNGLVVPEIRRRMGVAEKIGGLLTAQLDV
jgi:hypothetical protein